MAVETADERDRRMAEERKRNAQMLEASKGGFMRGGLYGLGGSLGVSLLAQRMSASYRVLRLPIKAAFVSMATFGAAAFASEHAIYRRRKYPEQRLQDRSLMQTLIDHRLAVVGSTVGVVVAAAIYRMASKEHTTGAQKFMNVRLYGQMAGLVAIIGLMGLTAARKTVPDDKGKEQERPKKKGA